MSEHKSEYRYESASCEDDDLYDLNLKSGSGVSDSRSTMFEENGRQKTGTMFEEDGDAGSPSVFQSARPVASGVRVNTEPKVVASGLCICVFVLPDFVRTYVHICDPSDQNELHVGKLRCWEKRKI